jgi:hypothetical protein
VVHGTVEALVEGFGSRRGFELRAASRLKNTETSREKILRPRNLPIPSLGEWWDLGVDRRSADRFGGAVLQLAVYAGSFSRGHGCRETDEDPRAAAHRRSPAIRMGRHTPRWRQGILLNVVVGNSGPTVAKKVRVKVDPPLPSIDQLRGRVQIAETILADGIESLPPGRILSWPLGQAFNLMNDGRPQSYKFTVTANGPFGAIPALNYIVDLGNWRESLNRPAGNLHQLTLAVNGLGKEISGLRVNESQ